MYTAFNHRWDVMLGGNDGRSTLVGKPETTRHFRVRRHPGTSAGVAGLTDISGELTTKVYFVRES